MYNCSCLCFHYHLREHFSLGRVFQMNSKVGESDLRIHVNGNNKKDVSTICYLGAYLCLPTYTYLLTYLPIIDTVLMLCPILRI